MSTSSAAAGGGLQRSANWPGLASEAGYCASQLAKMYGVSLRQLERFFSERWGARPKEWLGKLRDRRAVELLKESFSIKEVAHLLGYKTVAHFSSSFKKRHGLAPTAFIRSNGDLSRFGNTMSRFDNPSLF